MVEASEFEDRVLRRSHDVPVVVAFGSKGCQPCHILEPVLEQAAEARRGRVEVVKIDVEESPGLAMRQLVMALPTVKVFRGGRSRKRVTGVRSREAIDRLLDEFI